MLPTDSFVHRLSPDQHARLMAQARRDADRLRREAIAAFWSAAASALGRLWQRATARSRRLAAAWS